ncbi:MAG: hypothetical protein CMD81_16625 [Gammaproteobacteria bacterium]|nr:hypothetical protein [Gammaproteobacteria bacterium]HBF09049.1 hypothetical protein [Gammaproteobacteria bacterium]|tara:strand:- start:156 stop:1307 length:1152 start_codon:yes stop_codon:yes gene_type:complete
MNVILYDALIPGMNILLESLASRYSLGVLPETQQALQAYEAKNDVKAIFVRSTTKVNDAFLSHFPNVKFIATATSGTDHLDIAALEARGIFWMDAKGSNAKAVGDYVAYMLMLLNQQKQIRLESGKAVVVGYGCVGHEVKANLAQLGLNAHWVDPFLSDEQFDSIEAQVRLDLDSKCESWLSETSLLCIHTPLRKEEPWSTYQWLNEERLAALPDGAVIIAAGRGEVLDQDALLNHAHRLTYVLDVWPLEPNIVFSLLDRAAYATPHIAGHSKLGKLKGSWQVVEGFMAWAGYDLPLHKQDFFADMLKNHQGTIQLPKNQSGLSTSAEVLNQSLVEVAASAFDFNTIDKNLRAAVHQSSDDDTGLSFKAERKKYPQHPEIEWQ